MRAYYKITEMEIDHTAYRNQLYRGFMEKNMATADGLYRTTGTVHSGYYSKRPVPYRRYCSQRILFQTACTVPPVLFTAGDIPNKLHDSLKLLDLLPVPCTKQ